MLGIDIVDLKDPKLKERNQRSLDLIKHPDDTLIEHPHLFWLLWSAKEAAFKYEREPINFAPSKIPILMSQEEELISFRSAESSGKIMINENYVLAICGDLANLNYEVFEKDHGDERIGLRKKIISFFKEKGKDYEIGSDGLNLPMMEPSKSIISISHHGRFGAMVFHKNLLSAVTV